MNVEVSARAVGAGVEEVREYTSPSPDDKALVEGAALPEAAVEVVARTADCITLRVGPRVGLDTMDLGPDGGPLVQDFAVHHIMEFTSDRMRMSALVTEPSGRVREGERVCVRENACFDMGRCGFLRVSTPHTHTRTRTSCSTCCTPRGRTR